ncbi:MAG: DUF899 domain-containing protein [Acidimicrobiales bacterium]
MSLPEVVSRDEWLVARRHLLAEEKEMTRARDQLNVKRRELPMVTIDKEYVFEGPSGKTTLLDLFDGRSQLMVQHFMFDPAWDAGCPACTCSLDEMSEALITHLHSRDTTFVAISRAPIDKIGRYREQRGWTFPWYSSNGSDFNYDFNVTIDPAVAPVVYNYRDIDELKENGYGWLADGSSEQSGMSVFLRDDDTVFHAYSTFGRGMEALGGPYAFLDLTPLGRQEEWELPLDRGSKRRPNMPLFDGGVAG